MSRIEHLKVKVTGYGPVTPGSNESRAMTLLARLLRPSIPGVVLCEESDGNEIEFMVAVDMDTLEAMSDG